jgi:hypothetical protein
MRAAAHSRRRLARFIAQIDLHGDDACFWAEHCGWIPGSGVCRIGADAECQAHCLFAASRTAEAEAIRRLRQQRRRPI